MSRKHSVTAGLATANSCSTGPSLSGGAGSGSGGYSADRYSVTYDRLEEGSVIEDWIPRDLPGINKMMRQIYIRDGVAGPAVDIYATLPWSGFDLVGLDDDPAIREFYEDASKLFGENAEHMSDVTIEYLTLGRFAASLLYNETKGYWDDYMPHDSDFLTITPVPVRGFDPKLDLMLSPAVRQFISSQDYRDRAAMTALPDHLMSSLRTGRAIALDPLATLWVARRTSPYDYVGTSLFCVTGDSIVHTEKGSFPIASLVDHDIPADPQEKIEREYVVNTATGTSGNISPTSHWVYSGISPIKEVVTSRGYNLTATPDHPVLTLDPQTMTVSKKVLKSVKKGDLVAIDYSTDLWPPEDPLLPHVPNCSSRRTTHLLPKRMSPALAKVLGYLVSEGHIGDRIEFPQKQCSIVDDFQSAFQEVFPTANVCRSRGSKGQYIACVYSQHLLEFFRTLFAGHVSTYVKRIPACIWEAPKATVAQFLAALFEGDGTSATDLVQYYSSSDKLLKDVQILLLKFGILSTRRMGDTKGYVTVNGEMAKTYMENIGFRSSRKATKFLIEKDRKPVHNRIPGLPAYLTDFVGSRRLSRTYYEDDRGERTQSRLKSMLCLNYSDPDRLLPQLEKISINEHNKIATIHEKGLYWDSVSDVNDADPAPVYDLCVPGDHTFVANGLVVGNTRIIPYWALEKALLNATVTAARRRAGNILHVTAGLDDRWEPTNDEMEDIAGLFIQVDEDPVGAVVVTRTGVDAQEIRQGGSLWKMSDEWQYLSEGKMRALGINEALLSGESTYNNYEQARNAFAEQLRQLRAKITEAVYIQRFRTLARAHGFVHRKKADLSHRVRTNPTSHQPARPENPGIKLQQMGDIKITDLPQEEALQIPDQDLIVPEIYWHKTLQPEADDQGLDLLDRLADKGFPVTLNMLAARAGQDLEDIMSSLDDDAKLREKVNAWKKKVTPEEGGDDYGGFANTLNSPEIKPGNTPLWDSQKRFLGLSWNEAVSCVTDMVARGGKELFQNPDDVMGRLNELLDGNTHKMQTMAYLLQRMGFVQAGAIPLEQKDTAEIAGFIAANTVGSPRDKSKELLHLANVTSQITVENKEQLHQDIMNEAKKSAAMAKMVKAEASLPEKNLLTGV